MKTLLSLVSNAKAFEVRRTYVLVEMSLRFNTNAKAFWGRENKGMRCTENSCQFENLFLTKLT
ncbi:hypothetical protein, partial [Phocaeicola plebeius]|uniref:hypothetical protein n=1 Tax=Phocaeicola plebeius TaxID=310297 RepID=UPI00307D0C44